MVGRLGGDEFAVLMPDTEPLEVPTTLSVGVSGLDCSTR